MYYYENRNEWEKKLTRDFVTNHESTLNRALNLTCTDKIIVGLQKNKYGKDGDVDLAILRNTDIGVRELIAVEIKVIHLNEKNEWESEKLDKHNKQVNQLVKEGWDYVYFFDFIVTKEEPTWFHSQALDGYDRYRKSTENAKCGHIVFQINPVVGKSEELAGSISFKQIRRPTKNEESGVKSDIVKAVSTINFGESRVYIDGV